MRRIVTVLLSSIVVLAMQASPGSARSLTVRTDPNDTASQPDIRKVWSGLSVKGVYIRIGAWERLGGHGRFSVLLDTRGSLEYDRIIEISGGDCVVEKIESGSLGAFIGRRGAHRPSPHSISCRPPAAWFKIRKVVRFAVLTGTAGESHDDRAPNAGRYIGL
jgi:hypothetical protein